VNALKAEIEEAWKAVCITFISMIHAYLYVCVCLFVKKGVCMPYFLAYVVCLSVDAICYPC
jgi:cell shape-determining protein MreD